MRTNILVEYDGGGYDGCIWEWNYFFIDKAGKFYDIHSSGSGGITTKQAAMLLIDNLGNSFSNKVFIYPLDNEEELKTFATESACPNIRGVVKWFNDHNDPDAEPFAICSECGSKLTDADDIHLIDIHGCGGLASTADNIVCSDCYFIGICDNCQEYSGEENIVNTGTYAVENEYENKAAEKLSSMDYNYVCKGCIEYQAEQIEQGEKQDLLFLSISTGTPDMFSDEMKWLWGA